MTQETNLKPWGKAEEAAWLAKQTTQRSYKLDVLSRITLLNPVLYTTEQYGALSYTPDNYPLWAVKVGTWDNNDQKPLILVTGGVHGYETSGVMGALQFLEEKAPGYSEQFNIVVAPCVSPWGYETVNRWNPQTIDPNRAFKENSQSPEAMLLMAYINTLGKPVDFHIDLHETTDTDATIFMPTMAAKAGEPLNPSYATIPDGFYLVNSAQHPNEALERAIITAVEQVTHIALPDKNGRIIDEPVRIKGVIDYVKHAGLCAHFTGAADRLGAYTTEIYPDSPKATPEICNAGQIAAITGALDYLIEHS